MLIFSGVRIEVHCTVRFGVAAILTCLCAQTCRRTRIGVCGDSESDRVLRRLPVCIFLNVYRVSIECYSAVSGWEDCMFGDPSKPVKL